MQVYVSTLNFGAGPLSGTVSELSRLTYPAVEISSGHTPEDDTFGPVLSYAQDYKASVILHNFAPPETGSLLVNLSEPDANGRDSVIKFIKSRIDLTKELGSDYYSFHGGYRVPFRFGVRDYLASETLDRQVALEIFLQGLREVVAHAEAQRVHIGVENHVAMRESEGKLILYDQADFEVMFSEVGSDFLHLHLDVGHLKVTCEALEVDPHAFIERFRDKIMTVHLHDNDGKADRHQPFDSEAWFLPQLRQLPQLQYACLETLTQGDKDRIHGMMSLLKNLE